MSVLDTSGGDGATHYAIVVVAILCALGMWKISRDQAAADAHLSQAGCSVVRTRAIAVGDGGVEHTWRCPNGTEYVNNW